MKHYDVIVIGSGQGGSPLSHKLADRGQNVALIEKEHLGGSCVNYGCTPTKTMIASGRIAHYARRASEFGVKAGPVSVDLEAVVQRKDDIVKKWRQGQINAVEERDTLHFYPGVGRFVGERAVEVEGQELRGEKVFINTGTRSRIPDIEGIGEVDYLTNKSILDLKDLASHLIVVGGGYIGLEFGQLFSRLGSRVTLIQRAPQLLPREDEDTADELCKALREEGLEIRLESEIVAVERREGALRATVADSEGGREEIAGSHLLLAAGRLPNTEELDCQAAGVETDDKGFVRVNDRLETSAHNVWAIGDVKGGPAFTHISYDDHFVALENLQGGDRSIEGRLVPYAVFTDPELGRVGLTEKAARERGYEVKIGKIPMAHVARAIERDETAGLMKIVIDAQTDRILGAAILGPEGGEVVQTLMALMKADAPWTVFENAIFIHPTLVEGFFSLMASVGSE